MIGTIVGAHKLKLAMEEMSNRYNHLEIEAKWYTHWMEQEYFKSVPDDREPFTIVMPPPNVTGILHMGHMLNNTIQDVLIRKARLEGKNACWVPGTDHASIATEAKVVKQLREQGIKKMDIGRSEFLSRAFEWKEKYGGIILEQLKKLGCSADWSRTRFTMEESLSKAVIKVFVDLYKKGKIYRSLRMTNWDPEAKTALSNEEVLYKEENGKLYYIKYKLDNAGESITIATTRPETILGDTAVAVHPEDERFKRHHGKLVEVPIVGRKIPIIVDKYVDMEFGTGALKITPAHDMNDYEIGQMHKLETIDIFEMDATITSGFGQFSGQSREKARVAIVESLIEIEALDHVEDYKHKVGRSERTNALVEPKLTMQWFLKMDKFASTALSSVNNGSIKFFPPHFYNMFKNWLCEENIRDWCISRQLWWGQQIPAYYYNDHIVVAETRKEAINEIKKILNIDEIEDDKLKQDEDVVDTWFSSWLWPISVFNGFESEDELKYYYPTNVLVTAWDIIFFWVARMIMAGYEWVPSLLKTSNSLDLPPFKDVYFTGMVRDLHRKKMSKSLGNSPDALKLIEKYGADGVRFGILKSAPAGNDIVFDAPFDKQNNEIKNESKLCEQGLNFCNKIWNAARLVLGMEVTESNNDQSSTEMNMLAYNWINSKLSDLINELNTMYKTYRLSDALNNIYNSIWNDFFSQYLEIIKPSYGNPIDKKTRDLTIELFEKLMQVLHPFMPFVTEEIWNRLGGPINHDRDCIVSNYPKSGKIDKQLMSEMSVLFGLISSIREVRNSNQIKEKELLPLFVEKNDETRCLFDSIGKVEILKKLGYIQEYSFVGEQIEESLSFLSSNSKYYLKVKVDIEAERNKLKKEIEDAKGFLFSVEKKLSNENFVNNAPEKVVAIERKKLEDGRVRLKILTESLQNLR